MVCVRVCVESGGCDYGMCEGTYVCVGGVGVCVCIPGHTREQLDNLVRHFLDAVNYFFKIIKTLL